MQLCPIVLFTYKRLNTLKQTLEALISNPLANSSDLIIFSDGPKSSKDKVIIDEVRVYLKKISGFKTITILESPTNKGLANSIIDGVTDVINQYGKVIVLEDDLIVSPNFLVFMNAALDFYELNNKVYSISGYSLKVNLPENYVYDVYFTTRGLSWGWATWKDRWEKVDWEIKDFGNLLSDKKARERLAIGGTDLFPMLKKQLAKNIDSWAVRWFYSQYRSSQLTVFPILSKVKNIGFDIDATHTNVYNRYKVYYDTSNKQKYNFESDAILNTIILHSFQRYYGLFQRIFYGRIISPFYKLKRFLLKIK
jgi:hypothetical protein